MAAVQAIAHVPDAGKLLYKTRSSFFTSRDLLFWPGVSSTRRMAFRRHNGGEMSFYVSRMSEKKQLLS